MKAVGLIVEYNPFHNGHAYHLEMAKKASGADIVIAVMSGNFLQRGEPALVSKWCRTKMALQNGADIVFELPYRFSTQKAETFANGAISILDAAGCDSVCFGSESGDIHSFTQTLDYMDTNQQQFDHLVKQFMETGVSYPKALSLAFSELKNSENYLDLSKPNNILGFQYIRAIKKQNSPIKAITVARKNADYHDEHFASETIASATSIRKALFASENGKAVITQYVPEPTSVLLTEYLKQYGVLHQWENYWNLLQFRLIQTRPDELKEIYEVEEGLENRLVSAALEANSFNKFIEKIKTKRYTRTRLQRVCLQILTNTKKTEMPLTLEKASYLRLLGMTSSGKDYLNKMKNHFSLPLISKLSSYKHDDVSFDIKATRIYSFALPEPLRNEMMMMEYNQPPIFIEQKAEIR
jgi:predicted nucleotidyltransferase